MLESFFIRKELALVIREKGRKAAGPPLDSPGAVFVWGELMDPEFVKGLLGHYAAFAPAVLKGFERRTSGGAITLRRKPGAAIQGVVLLGLSVKDIRILDEFERVGKVMRRTTCRVAIGQYRRKTYMYLAISPK